jgi:hypothetical protein
MASTQYFRCTAPPATFAPALEQIANREADRDRSLRIEEISPEDAPRELVGIMPESVVQMLRDAWSAASGQPAFASSTVSEITGTPAQTFLEWTTDHPRIFERARRMALEYPGR